MNFLFFNFILLEMTHQSNATQSTVVQFAPPMPFVALSHRSIRADATPPGAPTRLEAPIRSPRHLEPPFPNVKFVSSMHRFAMLTSEVVLAIDRARLESPPILVLKHSFFFFVFSVAKVQLKIFYTNRSSRSSNCASPSAAVAVVAAPPAAAASSVANEIKCDGRNSSS
jgi:hypothetical protein